MRECVVYVFIFIYYLKCYIKNYNNVFRKSRDLSGVLSVLCLMWVYVSLCLSVDTLTYLYSYYNNIDIPSKTKQSKSLTDGIFAKGSNSNVICQTSSQLKHDNIMQQQEKAKL